jgi:hypothetical protein
MQRTREHDDADRLAKLRWPRGFVCACGASKHYRLQKRPRVFVCSRWGKQTSVTAGTLMHGAHLEIRAWFVAAELMARPHGVTAADLERRLDVHYETAWQLLQRLRGGLRRAGQRVSGALQLGHAFLTYAAPTTRPATRLGHGAWVLLDERGRVAIGTARPPFPYRERLERGETFVVPAAQRRQLRGPAADLARALRHRWMRIHFAVSERWAQRYACEFEVARGPVRPDGTGILAAALRHSNQAFHDFRPEWTHGSRPWSVAAQTRHVR